MTLCLQRRVHYDITLSYIYPWGKKSKKERGGVRGKEELLGSEMKNFLGGQGTCNTYHSPL